MIKIGVIGGSGLDNPDILKDAQEYKHDTHFGLPSSSIREGTINGVKLAIIARHGRDHTIPPTQVNNRANIRALSERGCTHILATTACGSLKEEIGRGDFVIPDQFIDFTRHREITFFDSFKPKEMKHTPMADPFDANMRKLLIKKAVELGIKTHGEGTIVTIEGPRFSTRAESNMFRIWGADLINMSTAPEAILANEAGIPYAVIAMSTDYDCWKADEEPVSWQEVIKVFNRNSAKVIELIIASIDLF
ncbi:MAG: S-methyl-5'-thioadenosine phosphorylase [Bacteroidales bacterium]|nr:S-methyl-5'-thioadenosine phosphorylase [Bacteroidales bacterium]